MKPPRPAVFLPGSWILVILALTARAGDLKFDRVVIDADFPGAYQVEVADVNGDGKPDVVAVGGGTCAWYENPTWKKRVVTGPKQTPGIISSATRDLLGDGRAEIAIAYEFEMNEPARGKLLLASQKTTDGLDAPWSLAPIADIGSIHRLRWGDLNGDNRPDLVVAPLFGANATPPRYDQEGASLSVFYPKREGNELSMKGEKPDITFPVLHAIDVIDVDKDGISEVYTASNRGVIQVISGPQGGWAFRPLVEGYRGEAPKRGASEIHVGRLRDGRRFLTTVEPWHGTEVAVYLEERAGPIVAGPPRNVIDSSLKDGHALWVADFDGDGNDEILAGFRGPGTSVLAYQFNGKTWDRTVVDDKIAAQDLRAGRPAAARTPDAAAVGGSTHNVVWYRPRKDGH